MTVLAPYDGSALSSTALEKAAEYADFRDEELVVLTVIPDDEEFARERGWINEGEPFRIDAIEQGLRTRATEVAPEATYRTEVVDSDEPTATAASTVVRAIRAVAQEIEASVVFVGSENAGSVIRPDSSVGGSVASDSAFDVYVVRKPADE